MDADEAARDTVVADPPSLDVRDDAVPGGPARRPRPHLVLLGYRFVVGLGEPTNLTDKWPWALWTWWKLSAVSLAGAGYSTMFMIHFMGRERYRDVERGAFVVSMLGYLMLCSALLIDLGQWYNAYRPVYNWGFHSVMFELFWCVGSYTVVQVIEFFVIFEERVPWKPLHRVLHKIHAPLLLLACFLPVFHQSALVSLYVITKGRLDPLWWSQLLPVYAVVTFFYIGPAVVLLENVIAHRMYGRPVHMRIISDMLPVTTFIMFVYLVTRIADYAVRGVLPELSSGSLYGNIALIELGIGVALPMVMFANRDLRTSRSAMVTRRSSPSSASGCSGSTSRSRAWSSRSASAGTCRTGWRP